MDNPGKYIEIEVKEYIKEQVNHLKKNQALIQEKNDKALSLATKEMERRLEGMNEFREQLNKQAGTFATREAYDLKIESVEAKISALQKIIYIGIGVVLVIEVVLSFLLK